MSRFDRLTTLINRFTLSVHPAPLATATLIVTAQASGARRVSLAPQANFLLSPTETALFAARVDWGGAANPLMAALPALRAWDLDETSETSRLVALIIGEAQADRCGAHSVLNRLGEALIVHLLRAQIAAGTAETGVLAGLSDPKLSRALVAIHDQPDRAWRNDDLAAIAGLSLSRFAELFLATIGLTPAAYVRNWRLTLARQEILNGSRVDLVARRYGFRSPDGFSRAFQKHFGDTPIKSRRAPETENDGAVA